MDKQKKIHSSQQINQEIEQLDMWCTVYIQYVSLCDKLVVVVPKECQNERNLKLSLTTQQSHLVIYLQGVNPAH